MKLSSIPERLSLRRRRARPCSARASRGRLRGLRRGRADRPRGHGQRRGAGRERVKLDRHPLQERRHIVEIAVTSWAPRRPSATAGSSRHRAPASSTTGGPRAHEPARRHGRRHRPGHLLEREDVRRHRRRDRPVDRPRRARRRRTRLRLHPIDLMDSGSIEVGDTVVAIGSPFGLEQTVAAGIVSALNREISAPNGFAIDDAIQTDAAINHGNSGGPLLDLSSRVSVSTPRSRASRAATTASASRSRPTRSSGSRPG